VLFLRSDKIEYCNAAARSLFTPVGAPLAQGDGLPMQLPNPSQAPCSCVVELHGRSWTVLLQKVKGGTLYRLSPLPDENEETLEQLRRLSIQFQLYLSHTGLAVEALQKTLSEMEQLRSKTAISRLNRSLHQLLRLSDHLDLYTRTDEDLMILHPSHAIDLTKLCQKLEADVAPLAAALGQSFQFEGEKDVVISGNEVLLQRVLYNLISNSLRSGGDIRLKLVRRENTAVLTLTDNGKGLPTSQLQNLFALGRDVENMGFALGLPLSQRLARLYKGQLILSPLRQGTAISLSLPLWTDTTSLHSHISVPESGFNTLLVELSDVLPDSFYGQEDVL
jgi:signal transduction histidine kinase